MKSTPINCHFAMYMPVEVQPLWPGATCNYFNVDLALKLSVYHRLRGMHLLNMIGAHETVRLIQSYV